MAQSENNRPKNNREQRKEVFRGLSLASNLGITLASCLFIGVFLGRTLDRLLGTAPKLVLVFSLLGVAAAIIQIIRLGKDA